MGNCFAYCFAVIFYILDDLCRKPDKYGHIQKSPINHCIIHCYIYRFKETNKDYYTLFPSMNFFSGSMKILPFLK